MLYFNNWLFTFDQGIDKAAVISRRLGLIMGIGECAIHRLCPAVTGDAVSVNRFALNQVEVVTDPGEADVVIDAVRGSCESGENTLRIAGGRKRELLH